MWTDDVPGSLEVQQTGFMSHWDPYAVLNLETVASVHIVTRRTGSGGTEAYLSGQLATFSALTLLVGSSVL